MHKRVKIPIRFTIQILFVLMRVAFFTLLERVILGQIQTRKGPNKPSAIGLLVPFADALKLIRKEMSLPRGSNKAIFLLIPTLSLTIPLFLWGLYPTPYEALKYKYSIMLFLCISACGVYGILGAGWRRNSSYSIMGAIRAVAQSISYEVVLSIIVIHYIIFFFYNICNVKLTALGCYLFSLILLLFSCSLAETNRAPFDFSEGESELVSGFNTEFSAVPFVLIFLAEYIAIIFIATLLSSLFNITGYIDLYLYLMLWGVTFIWIRGSLPRIRYDQLMYIAWKRVLPIVLGTLCCTICL